MKIDMQSASNAVKAPYVLHGLDALTAARAMAYVSLTFPQRMLAALAEGDVADYHNQLAFMSAIKGIHDNSTSTDGDNPPETGCYTLQLGAQDAFTLGVCLHVYSEMAERAAREGTDESIQAATAAHGADDVTPDEIRQRALEDAPRALRICKELGAWAAKLDPASTAEATRAVAEERAGSDKSGFWDGHEDAKNSYDGFISNFLGDVPPSATLN